MKKKLLSLICMALFAGVTVNAAITVRLKASTTWDPNGSVNLWAWNDYDNIFSDWPGATIYADADGWFSYTFNEGISKVNIIWSYGGDYQSNNITNITGSTCFELSDSKWSSYHDVVYVDCPAGTPGIIEEVHREITVTARSDKSDIHMTIGDDDLEKVTSLKVNGSINSYDIMIIRNKMINLKKLDLTDADILANSYEYYTGQCSLDSVLTPHAFDNTIIAEAKLPKSLKNIMTETFNKDVLQVLEINGGRIGSAAFYEYNALQKVTINNCDTIEGSAFYRCRDLQTVTLSAPLSYIGNQAFYNCYSLTSINLPSSLQTIERSAFQGAGLTSITIPKSVTSIGSYAFAGSNNKYDNYHYGSDHNISLVEQGDGFIKFNGEIYNTNNMVIQPDQDYLLQYGSCYPVMYREGYETEYGYWQSSGYYYYNGSSWVYWDDHCWESSCFKRFKRIGNQLFVIGNNYDGGYYAYGNGSLQSVIFEKGSTITKFQSGVFEGNNNLTEFVFPENLQIIGYYALAGCAIESIVLPESVFYIDDGAFLGATSTSIEIPQAVEEINAYSFYNCQNLQEVNIASTIRNVGDHAFDGCPNIKKVYTYTVEPTQIDQNTFSCWKNADLYVPETSYYNYYYNTQWSQFLKLVKFDVPYDYFYVNDDYELGGSTGLIDGQPDADLNPGSGLVVTGDTPQEMGEITQHITQSISASIVACEQSLLSSKLRIKVSMESGVWYFLCFPFDLPLSSIAWLGQFAIYEYNGAIRAANGSGGWVKNTASALKAGKGYIFQSAISGDIEFTIPNPVFSCNLVEQLLPVYAASAAYDANWTLIGNPFPAYFDMDELFSAGFNAPVYVRSKDRDDYDVYMPHDDEYHFHPYEAFFVQNPGDVAGVINWNADGRETLKQAQEKSNKPARRMAVQDNRHFVELRLASEDLTQGDHTRVVFNDEAQMAYELGRDAVKMAGKAPVRLYSLDSETQYAINERPAENGYVQLGFSVAKDGDYVLSASRLDASVTIYDNVEKQEVDLTLGDYHFHAKAGVDNERFAISRIKQAVTSIDELSNVIEGKVNVYSISGILMAEQVELNELQLPAGAYVFQSDKMTRTVILK